MTQQRSRPIPWLADWRFHGTTAASRRTAHAPVLRALLLLAAAVYLVVVLRSSIPLAPELDFAQYYGALAHVQAGDSLYDPTPVRGGINWHPPHFHLLVWPFYQLGSLQAAYLAWNLVSILIVGVAVWRFAPSPWAVPFAVFSAPMHALLSGQSAALVAVPLILAWKQAQGWLFGAYLMTATVLKPFLLPLWLLPLKARDWRAFAGGTGAAAGWFALGSIAFGWNEHLNWLAQRDRDFPWADHFLNSSFAALVAHGVHPSTVPAWWLGAIGILSVTAWAVWTRPMGRTQAWCLLTMAGLLASPLAWIYYWIFLLPAVTLWGAPWVTVLAVGALWPTLLSQGSVAAVYPAALLIAWILAVLFSVRGADSTQPLHPHE